MLQLKWLVLSNQSELYLELSNSEIFYEIGFWGRNKIFDKSSV